MKLTKAVVLLTLAGTAVFAQKQPKTTTINGVVTDSYCARDGHGEAMQVSKDMGKTSASCTLVCVQKGAKFVLLERGTGRVYNISDQLQAQKYAGQAVKIVGSMERNKIAISSIEADEMSEGGGATRSRRD